MKVGFVWAAAVADPFKQGFSFARLSRWICALSLAIAYLFDLVCWQIKPCLPPASHLVVDAVHVGNRYEFFYVAT